MLFASGIPKLMQDVALVILVGLIVYQFFMLVSEGLKFKSYVGYDNLIASFSGMFIMMSIFVTISLFMNWTILFKFNFYLLNLGYFCCLLSGFPLLIITIFKHNYREYFDVDNSKYKKIMQHMKARRVIAFMTYIPFIVMLRVFLGYMLSMGKITTVIFLAIIVLFAWIIQSQVGKNHYIILKHVNKKNSDKVKE